MPVINIKIKDPKIDACIGISKYFDDNDIVPVRLCLSLMIHRKGIFSSSVRNMIHNTDTHTYDIVRYYNESIKPIWTRPVLSADMIYLVHNISVWQDLLPADLSDSAEITYYSVTE